MKMVKRTQSPTGSQANGVNGTSEEYIGHGEDHLIAFDLQDIIDLNVSNVEFLTSESKAQNGEYYFVQTLRHLLTNKAPFPPSEQMPKFLATSIFVKGSCNDGSQAPIQKSTSRWKTREQQEPGINLPPTRDFIT